VKIDQSKVIRLSPFGLDVNTLVGVTRPDLTASNPEMLYSMVHLHLCLRDLLVTLGTTLIVLGWDSRRIPMGRGDEPRRHGGGSPHTVVRKYLQL
jgi:hypothetical protein